LTEEEIKIVEGDSKAKNANELVKNRLDPSTLPSAAGSLGIPPQKQKLDGLHKAGSV
jgi:hypothetical protein